MVLAEKIYNSNQKDTINHLLKGHIFEMLRKFEIIARAYDNDLADQKIVEESLSDLIITLYDIVHSFIDVSNSNNSIDSGKNYDRWPYLRKVINE